MKSIWNPKLRKETQKREQAEQALRSSGEMFAKAFQALPDWVTISRMEDGRYLEVNEACCRATGWQREEMIGKSSLELGLWKDPAERAAAIETMQQQGGLQDVEATFLTKDGSEITVLWSAAPIRLGSDDYAVSVVKDITGRVSDQKKLTQSLKTTAALLELVPDMIFGFDRNGNYTFYKAPTNFPSDLPDPPVGLNMNQFVSQEIIDRRMELAHEAIRIQRPVRHEYFLDKEGESSHREAMYIPHEGYGVLAVVRDITERKQAEKELRANQQRLNAILEANPDPVVVYDAQGKTSYINPAFTRLFGWEFEELEGKRIPFVPDDEAQKTGATIAELYQHGGPVSLETKRYAKDGSTKNILISAASIKDHGGAVTGMVVNLTDITDKKLLESQLNQAQKMEAIGTLAGGIAHDFNNILAAITGYTELTIDSAEDHPVIVRELKQVLKATDRARDLVKQILTFSRKGEAEMKPLNLNKEVAYAAKMLERTIPKMVSVELNLGRSLNLVEADANQIEQVLMNLGTNASDAMPDGGRLIIETQNITLDEDYTQSHLEVEPGDYVLLSVSDTGEGMTPEVMEKIFDPFFTTKELGKGTGLGMSIIFGIVKDHKGYISCYSEPGIGTTFKIYLPVTEAASNGGSASGGESLQEFGGTETILLVDDEKPLRDIGAQILGQRGYQILTAASGEQALAVYRHRRKQIGLVVLDIGMPGMGGHKCLQKLLEIDPEVKVVVASGYSREGQLKDTLLSGALGYVPKPYRKIDLLAAVRTALDNQA